jgi:hypothetical protein
MVNKSLKRRDAVPQTEGYTPPPPPPLTEGYTLQALSLVICPFPAILLAPSIMVLTYGVFGYVV